MQLLELVEVLITDHRTSLLERQRLQQQLDSTQQALQAERLDKERAAALADLRCDLLAANRPCDTWTTQPPQNTM